MAVLGALTISSQGMRSQATALGVIATNVANVQSGGYKRSDPFFKTLQSATVFEQSDLNSTTPVVLQRITSQGMLSGTSRDLDLAIMGDGMFITRTTFDNTGDIVYTRDGSFSHFVVNDITYTDPVSGSSISTKDSYLVDKNGNFLLGYTANTDGTFPTTGTPAPLRVDQFAFSATGRATTAIELAFNLNSNSPSLDPADPVVFDHASAVANFEATGLRAEGMEVFSIRFFDSLGVSQTGRLNFTKTVQNQWEMSLTYQGAPVAQVDTINIAGTIETGDTYSVGVNGATVSYTAVTGDTSADVIAGLVTVLNTTTAISTNTTAAAGAAGTLTLTSTSPGTSFTSTASATNATPTVQIDTLTISGAVEAGGDSYQITIDGNPVTYNVTGGEGSLATVVNNVINTINTTPPVNATIVATAGAGAGEIILTAITAGVPFVSSALAVNGGASPNTAAIVTTQANVATTADNTATTTITTANSSGMTNTTPTTVNFSGGGKPGTPDPANPGSVIPPSPISISITHPPSTPGGATSTSAFTMDITGFTQFASQFSQQHYAQNGYEAAFISRIGFDEQGHVLGIFANGISVQLYQIPLAKFTNPNALATGNGMTFRETTDSGPPDIQTISGSGIATFVPNALEISNVSLVDEFTSMIKTQRAYSSSAWAFQTVIEMLEVVKNMKR